MLLAELIVRHTRRHMPTRRVALEGAYLPTSGPAHGVALLAAVVATNLPAIDDEQRELLAAPARRRARRALDPAHRAAAPPAARRARPRPLAPPHARRGRQARGRARRARRARSRRCSARCWARRALPSSGRDGRARRDPARSSTGAGAASRADVEVRFVARRHVGLPAAAARGARASGSRAARPRRRCGAASAADQRWAMEVLGLRAGMDVERDDVNRRFRRLLRDAHPDSGGAGAARPRRGSPS